MTYEVRQHHDFGQYRAAFRPYFREEMLSLFLDTHRLTAVCATGTFEGWACHPE